MNEPTYRVTMTHTPEDGSAVCWTASVYLEGEYDDGIPLYNGWGSTREAAFTNAQAWCKAKASEPQAPSTVFLTEDGDLIDRHEVQA